MQKKTTFLVLAQVVCIVLFVSMACACKSQAPVATNNKVLETPCADPDYVYVGKFNTQAQAEDAAIAMGLTSICYKEQYCFGK